MRFRTELKNIRTFASESSFLKLLVFASFFIVSQLLLTVNF